jgi:hypothetical protein
VRASFGAALALCLTELYEWLVPHIPDPDLMPPAQIVTQRRSWREDGSHDR